MFDVPATKYDRYPQLHGDLFEAVQQGAVFEDSKTFVDSVPLTDPSELLEQYHERRDQPGFDLRTFVEEHFEVAEEVTAGVDQPVGETMEAHIENLWSALTATADESPAAWSTLIPLPYDYVKPGGRFREIYYWDSYFTAEGLVRSGLFEMVENMVANFAYLVDEYGFIPNGNRVYYLSRSQPPYFCQFLRLLEREAGPDAALEYLPQLRREYEFWMDGTEMVSPVAPPYRRVVALEDGSVLNRYWDDYPRPRPESYREDVEVAETLPPGQREQFYRDVRAACESGWDFSSRWFADAASIESIRTTDLVPIDLNALLYDVEAALAEWSRIEGHETVADRYETAADDRHEAIQTHCWDDAAGYYFDYCWADDERTDRWTLAGVVPLFVGLATDRQAVAVAETLRDRFLFDGGLVTTLTESGQQWDNPAGWAPLTWLAVQGLDRYGHTDLAREITGRWLDLNREVFDAEGYMMEKYDVVDASVTGNVGEYVPQAGFGWTNGVTLALEASLET